MSCFRQDRDGRGGGVLIAVKTDFIVQPIEELQTNCEILWVKLQLKNCKTLFVGAFYRPPETDIDYLTQLDLSL